MPMLESLSVEFKREYSESVKKTIIAFANTDGGALYIGVEDDGTIVGLSDAEIDATQLKVTTCIRNAIRPDVSVFTSCCVEELDQKKIVVVQVQLGAARPYYLEGKGIRPEGVFIRQGASSNPASETAIFNMIRENSALSYEETRCLEQELAFDTLQKAFQKKELPLNIQQMKTLKLMRPDEEYTNLALLLSEQCPHTIKIAEFQGIDKTLFRNRAEMGGSLLGQLQDVYDFIDRINKTSASFVGLERIDVRDYPPQAVREALLNLLVHRDYGFSASAFINIYDDRMEFVSVGGLVRGISYADLMLGISMPRNKALADVFYRLHLIEAYGTGIPKIMTQYEKKSLAPSIEVTDNAFKITLPNMNAQQTLAAPEKNNAFSQTEERALRLFDEKDALTRKEVEHALGISQTACINLLKRLAQLGLLQKNGVGRNTIYKKTALQ